MTDSCSSYAQADSIAKGRERDGVREREREREREKVRGRECEREGGGGERDILYQSRILYGGRAEGGRGRLYCSTSQSCCTTQMNRGEGIPDTNDLPSKSSVGWIRL